MNSLVFGTCNNAPVHNPDTPCLVSKWRVDGLFTGMTFRPSQENQSKAMKRHLLESKSLRFLLSKEGALASYIWENEGAYDQRHF